MTITLYCLLTICVLTSLRPARMAWRGLREKLQ